MRVAKNITELIGKTPLVELGSMGDGLHGRVLLKMESFNPCSSVKDRIGYAMIEDAISSARLTEGLTLVEPTSGNTGIALAFICAAKSIPLILTMPDTMSIERQNLLAAFGAQLILTPGIEGMAGAIRKAEQLCSADDKYVMLQQFKNPANPAVHLRTTGPEIWEDTDGTIDIFVSGVGTGGTITGVSEYIKQHKPSLYSVAVEPDASPVLSGGSPGPHKIQGIGAGFKPDNLQMHLVDEVLRVTNDDAMATANRLAREEGILCGISAGANVFAAMNVAARPENKGKLIVTIICDTGERYLSTDLFKQ